MNFGKASHLAIPALLPLLAPTPLSSPQGSISPHLLNSTHYHLPLKGYMGVPYHSGAFLSIEPLLKRTESHSNEKFECGEIFFLKSI